MMDSKKETSQFYKYLGWLDTHVSSRQRSKGNVPELNDTRSRAEDSDGCDSSLHESDERSDIELESSIGTSTSDENISKATGHAKWEKRDRIVRKVSIMSRLKC